MAIDASCMLRASDRWGTRAATQSVSRMVGSGFGFVVLLDSGVDPLQMIFQTILANGHLTNMVIDSLDQDTAILASSPYPSSSRTSSTRWILAYYSRMVPLRAPPRSSTLASN